MNLNHEVHGEAIVISVDEPRIDAAVAIQFKDGIREISQDGPARVILNMSKVEFLDSSGLGALVATMKELGAERSLELAELTQPVQKVFHLTRMDSVFTVHADVRGATG